MKKFAQAITLSILLAFSTTSNAFWFNWGGDWGFNFSSGYYGDYYGYGAGYPYYGNGNGNGYGYAPYYSNNPYYYPPNTAVVAPTAPEAQSNK